MIKIPEIQLYNTLQSFIKYLTNDLQTKTLQDSYVYRVFGGQKAGNYDFSTQLSQILLREKDSPNRLSVEMFFNASRAQIPTIHVTLPSENEKDNSLGSGAQLNEDGEEVYSRRFSATYNVVITSNNTMEVVGLYALLKSMFISYRASLETLGLQNVVLGGGDISPYQEILPNVFMRSLSVTLDVDHEGLELFPDTPINDITFIQTILPHG